MMFAALPNQLEVFRIVADGDGQAARGRQVSKNGVRPMLVEDLEGMSRRQRWHQPFCPDALDIFPHQAKEGHGAGTSSPLLRVSGPLR